MSITVRLQKLEKGRTAQRCFVVSGLPEERRATIDGLIGAGRASDRDLFVCTGVPRNNSTISEGYYECSV